MDWDVWTNAAVMKKRGGKIDLYAHTVMYMSCSTRVVQCNFMMIMA